MIRLAVFGQPVSQSLSPRIHRQFAAQAGLEIDYRAIESGPDEFPDKLAELAAAGGRGCNITMPLKREAWRLATRRSDRAERARAANTLIFETEAYAADNTDGGGLSADLQRCLGRPLGGLRICLLGAGGAAAGVLAALLEEKPDSVTVANRTLSRARKLVRRHADLGHLECTRPESLSDLPPFDLLINATSLGHTGTAPELSPRWLRAGGLCYDMNYGASAKPLQGSCAAAGIPYSDGLGMLVGQAALSFALWTGFKADTASVLGDLRGEL